jgi:predicted RecA/RadA family phage recombinase
MKNFVQPGRTLTVAAPTGGVNSGDPVLVGAIFGIANYSALAGADVEIDTQGVFALPKASGAAWAVGDILYWDSVAKNLTETAANSLVVGTATAAAASGDTVGNVKIGALGATAGVGISVAPAITNAVAAAANPPTQTEFNNLVTKFNVVLAALRGANIISD